MKTSRRNFLGWVFSGLVASTAIGLFLKSSTALGAPKKKAAAEVALPPGGKEVAADDAVATAIGYVADVSKVDKKKYAQFQPGQNCK